MFYEVKNGHGLPYDPYKAIVAPRPIGWISSISADGVPNLAPYSYFNALSSAPPLLMFSSETEKDSLKNVKDTGEFAVSLATVDLQNAMNKSSDTVPEHVNEFELANIESAQCEIVNAPRVAASPASLECKVVSIQELRDIHGDAADAYMVIGQVVAVHIKDEFLVDGRFDTAGAQPLARCGYRDYSKLTETFELMRPSDDGIYDGVDR